MYANKMFKFSFAARKNMALIMAIIHASLQVPEFHASTVELLSEKNDHIFIHPFMPPRKNSSPDSKKFPNIDVTK